MRMRAGDWGLGGDEFAVLRAKSAKQACGSGPGGERGRKGREGRVSGSRRRRQGSQRSFLNEAGQVEHEGEGIAEQGGFGGVGETEPGRALQGSASLGSIARLGVGLSADAQFPGIRADLHIACETDAAIWES